MKSCSVPRPVGPGAKVAVVAPAGPCATEVVDRVEPFLRAQGWQPHLYPGCRQHTGYLAGDDARRAEDLQAAFADPAIDAVLCLRGGYGCARLLDRLDHTRIARHAKPFVGYSDITALHIAFTQRCGFATWHGAMPGSELVRDPDPLTLAAWCGALTEPWPAGRMLPSGTASLHAVAGGRAQGRLVGGNLSVIASLLGTPWALDARGAIVFLEDVAEAPYRIDRCLTQLRLAGVLAAAAGFVLGSFTEAEDPLPVIAPFVRSLGKPVLAGWPAGHCKPQWPLPLGVQVLLDADAGTLQLA